MPAKKSNLDPEFDSSLQQFLADAKAAGHSIRLGSGFRDPMKQKGIIDSYKGKPGYKVSYEDGVRDPKGHQIVASMKGSYHSKGLAHDLQFDSDGAKSWAHNNAKKYKLNFPMSYEPWHVEKEGARSGKVPTVPTAKLTPIDNTPMGQVNQLTSNTVIPNVTTSASPLVTGSPVATGGLFTATGLQPFQDTPKKVVSSTTPVPKNNFASITDSVAPYVSNIANAFRKPPMPPKPILDTPVSLQRVNMNNDRYEAERGTRSADKFAENQLDPQAAFAAKAFNNAQRFNQLSSVNQAERNANTGISNREVELNTGVAASNRQLQRGYQNSLVERQLAQQQFQSENLANASDKYVHSQDVALAKDEAAAREAMARAQDWNGVYGRYEKKAMGGKLPRYSAGHMIKSMNLKPIN